MKLIRNHTSYRILETVVSQFYDILQNMYPKCRSGVIIEREHFIFRGLRRSQSAMLQSLPVKTVANWYKSSMGIFDGADDLGDANFTR